MDGRRIKKKQPRAVARGCFSIYRELRIRFSRFDHGLCGLAFDGVKDGWNDISKRCGRLLARGHIFDGDVARADLVLAKEQRERDAQLIRIADLCLEFLFLGIDLGTDALAAQRGGGTDGGIKIVGHGQDQHVGGGIGVAVEIIHFVKNIEQARQADRNADTGKLAVGVKAGEVIVAADNF